MIVSIADDDKGFRLAANRWIEKAGRLKKHIDLVTFEDPNSLLRFLRSKKNTQNKKIIVLLDLDFNGDKEGGLNALVKIKRGRGALKRIPIIIYTNTRDAAEVDKAYLRLANSFVWKGHGSKQKDRFIKLVQFWYRLAEAPVVAVSSVRVA